MKILTAGLCGLALLLWVAPASATIWTDGLNTPYVAPSPDIEGEFGGHDDWTDSTEYKVLDEDNSMVPVNWRFAQQSWNGEHAYSIAPDTVLKSEGDASMRITHLNSLIHQDVFVGVWITGLTIGEDYDISFDFQADAAHAGLNGYPIGTETGDDNHWSASWQVADVDDSPEGWGATEDYPGHETGSTWIPASEWDGNFNPQADTFTATSTQMAFVLKYRAMAANGQVSMRLDNFVVTPEPAGLLLLGLGGLVLRRRR